MAYLLGVAMFLALLWLWLRGNWFGWVVAFLPAAVIVWVALANTVEHPSSATPAMCLVLAVPIAGALTGIPFYTRRRRTALTMEHSSDASFSDARPRYSLYLSGSRDKDGMLERLLHWFFAA
jgi:hypothetical protein